MMAANKEESRNNLISQEDTKRSSSSKKASEALPNLTTSPPFSRRHFLKGTTAASILQATGVGTAFNLLMIPDVEAYSLMEELKRRYENNPVPPGATSKLCQDPKLCMAYIYLMTKGFGYDRMRTVLLHENISSGSILIDHQSWECEPLMYVALNTYRWKSRNRLDFNKSQKAYMKTYFFHQFELMEGINEFYKWHVIKREKGINPSIERRLLNNIFQAAEDKPGSDLSKTDEYLNGDGGTRLQLITELSNKYAKMKWTEADKTHRNIDINKGALGPLNNWYRLLSAQWGAFFLANEYWENTSKSGDDTHKNMSIIYNNLENPLSKKTYRLRNNQKYINKKI